MKKLITTTLVTCALVPIASTHAYAQENNSIKPESLKKPIKTKVSNDEDVKAYLQNNASNIIKESKESGNVNAQDGAFKQ